MVRTCLRGLLALGLASCLESATAQENVSRVSDKQMEAWLTGEKKIEWSRAGKGKFRLKLDGRTVVLNSTQVDCWLHVGFDTGGRGDLKAINTWNNRSRGTRAYLDEEGDPCLEMDIDFEGGINTFAFHGHIDWFRLQLKRFVDEVVP